MDVLRNIQVHYILVSYLGGRILTIFFKKDFSIEVHGTQLLNDALALGVSMAGIKVVPLGVVVALLELLLLLYKCFEYRKDEMIKTLVISFSIYVVLYVNLSEVVFDCGTLVLATTQFLRKPEGLKEQLREIRINCGPVYVISMCSGLRFHPIQDLTWDLPSLATKLAVIASMIAAVFFRPDNN